MNASMPAEVQLEHGETPCFTMAWLRRCVCVPFHTPILGHPKILEIVFVFAEMLLFAHWSTAILKNGYQ